MKNNTPHFSVGISENTNKKAPDLSINIGIDCSPLLNEYSKEHTYIRELIKYLAVVDKTDVFHILGLGYKALLNKPFEFNQHNFKRYIPLLPLPKVDIMHCSLKNTEIAKTFPEAVFSINDCSELAYPRIFTEENVSAFRKTVSKAVGSAKALIVPSQKAKSVLLDNFKIQADFINVVHFGIGEDVRPCTRYNIDLARARYGIKSDYIFSLISNNERCNTENLLKAYSLLKYESPPLLVIAGAIKGIKSRLQNIARKLDIVSNVRFIDNISQKELYPLFSGCEAFFYPAIYEGSSMSLLEAMACAAPVVASDRFSSKEIAGNAAVYFDPFNVEKMAESLRRVISDNDLKLDLRQKGLERAKMFSAKNMALETLKIYRETAAS